MSPNVPRGKDPAVENYQARAVFLMLPNQHLFIGTKPVVGSRHSIGYFDLKFTIMVYDRKKLSPF